VDAATAAGSGGYAKGRRRREQILAAAAAVYAEAGFDGASLREIAKRAGISHTGLLHHFPNRETLLAAVLEERDRRDAERGEPHLGAGAGALRELVELAGHNQRHPGIVELYVRMAAEAVAVEHPAHAYFTGHYRAARGYARASFAALAEAGELREGTDPDTAAVMFIALMDGLQVQWLTNPDEVDLVAPLRAFLRLVLSAPID
jgi:AcrR family transcriptional regulator